MTKSPRKRRWVAAAAVAALCGAALAGPADASFLSRCTRHDARTFASKYCAIDYATTNSDAEGGDANIAAAVGRGALADASDDACEAALRALLCPAVFHICEPLADGGVHVYRLCPSLR